LLWEVTEKCFDEWERFAQDEASPLLKIMGQEDGVQSLGGTGDGAS